MAELRMISAEGDEGFEGVHEQVIGLVIGIHGNLSRRTARIAAKLWRKAIRQCPQSLFELALMPDGGRSDDATRRYVRLFAKLTGLDQPETAHRWLSSRGLDFLQGFGIELRCPDCLGACTSAQRPDCLHCRLWEIIHREHPDGGADDVIIAVADVIGDYLNNKHARPLQDQLWQQTRERIVARMQERHHG
jgi:hypothetical protein